jgi:lysophospholipase L1-like esterase
LQHTTYRRISVHALVLTLLLVLLAGPWHASADSLAQVQPGHHHALVAHRPVGLGQPLAASVSFEGPRAQVPEQPDIASLAIPGRGGTYLVPYIQTQPDLRFKLRLEHAPPQASVLVTLDAEGGAPRTTTVAGPDYMGVFPAIGMGDHTLTADVYDSAQAVKTHGGQGLGDWVATTHLSHVARGDIIAAIGDSTTEGNGGPIFGFLPNWVSAQAMAADWTSADGRNFPQAGAAARPRSPASFTSVLGSILEGDRGHPVLVLNDGWSGATADAYSKIVSSRELSAEYNAALPNDWIINLGVNDPLTHQSPDQFATNMHTIVAELVSRYGATAGSVHVACPSWAAQDFRNQAETTYMPVIQEIRGTYATGAAPNFFSWYRDTPGDLADAVHPNSNGYRDMAALWAQSLGGKNTGCM